MNTKKILLAALLSCMVAPAMADEAGSPGQQVDKHVVTMSGDLPELPALEGLRFTGPMMHMHGRMVKNAPYIAETVSERQQNLADGNQIARKTSSMSYRDSAGSTRQETRDSKGELRSVTIHNVTDGATYILRPQDKTAIKIAKDQEISRFAGEAARARIEQLKKDGKLPAGHPADGEEIVKRVERADRTDVRKDVRVRIARNGADGQEININPAIAGAFGDMKWTSRATTKDLGVRDFDGVKAEGKLRSYDIPAGEVGNRNPITVSDETWYAPDLKVTVYSKHSDPRSGDNIYRLASLKRDEPAAALFNVPSDYAVKDATANFKTSVVEKK